MELLRSTRASRQLRWRRISGCRRFHGSDRGEDDGVSDDKAVLCRANDHRRRPQERCARFREPAAARGGGSPHRRRIGAAGAAIRKQRESSTPARTGACFELVEPIVARTLLARGANAGCRAMWHAARRSGASSRIVSAAGVAITSPPGLPRDCDHVRALLCHSGGGSAAAAEAAAASITAATGEMA